MADTLAVDESHDILMDSPGKRKRDPDAAESDNGDNVGELDEEMTCGVCMDILENPYSIIPCLHSVDYECLEEWWKSHDTCPVCASPAKFAKRSFQLRAILEKYLATRPNKRRELDPDAVPPSQGATPAELRPRGRNGDIMDDFEDDEEAEEEEGELDNPDVGRLVWPCFCCEPGNNFGHVCPDPIPEPTQEEKDEAQELRGPTATVPPERGQYIVLILEALARGKPGADAHAECITCHRYIPKYRQPEKDQCAKCGKWSCRQYDPQGCPGGIFADLEPRDNCDFPQAGFLAWWSIGNCWRNMPNRPMSMNQYELQVLEGHATTAALTAPILFSTICKAKLDSILTDAESSEQAKVVAKRCWGEKAHFCNICRNDILRDELLGWWMKERPSANLDAAIMARPDCWYGIECRTQGHNHAHAGKLNHICENSRPPQANIPAVPAPPIPAGADNNALQAPPHVP